MNANAMNANVTDEVLNLGKAYHEPAHAIVGVRFGRTILKLSILPQSDILGGVCLSEGEHPLILSAEGCISRIRLNVTVIFAMS